MITIHVITPLFLPKTINQPNIKDITVLIPSNSFNFAVDSLKTSGFRHIHAIVYQNESTTIDFFKTITKVPSIFDDSVINSITTNYVLWFSQTTFKIPPIIPKMPDKPMVIGYTFKQCYDAGFALLLPYEIDNSLMTKDSLLRFYEFWTSSLKKQVDSFSEAFHLFADFHSFHLIMMPCYNQLERKLPQWESIPVVENETDFPLHPWDSIKKIDEVWKIRDLL